MKRLDCVAQNYAWGLRGNSSMVARFKASSGVEIDSNECYAELWMGTHPSGPAQILSSKEPLLNWLTAHNAAVGTVPEGYAADNLPFLFKILSVRTALSLQTHPDKALARTLHEKFPDIYKDPNHKPEMVIALTPFECMCGFRTLNEIKEHFLAYPELREVVNHDGCVSELPDAETAPEDALKRCFASLMSCPAAVFAEKLAAMIARLATMKETTGALSPLDDLLLRLHEQYPEDIGVFSPLLTNYVRLLPGESFFIGANELHAYIAGECVECMALSDNVVRAGLTPKFKDCATLCSMLNYQSRLPTFLTPVPLDSCTSLYRPPVDCCAEFEVERIDVPAHTTYHPVLVGCGCILLLLKAGSAPTSRVALRIDGPEGEELVLPEGAVVFTAALQDVAITTGPEGASFFRAHVNLGSI